MPKCHYEIIDGKKFLIPYCWNRVIYGDEAECHCNIPDSKILEDRIEILEKQVQKLIKALR